MAGAAGIEPAVTVLETVGLPLTDAPVIPSLQAFFVKKLPLAIAAVFIRISYISLDFLVYSSPSAELAEFL